MEKDSKFLFDSDFNDKNTVVSTVKKKKKEKFTEIEAMDLPVLGSEFVEKFKSNAFNSSLLADLDNVDTKESMGLEEIEADKPIEDVLKDSYQEISNEDEPEPFEAPLPEKKDFEDDGEKEEKKESEVVETLEDIKEEVKEDLPPPPPTFSEEELEEAKKIATQIGYEKAKTEFETGLEKQISHTLTLISDQMSRISVATEQAIAEIKEGSLDVALAVCKKALPTLETKYSFLEVTKTILDVIDVIKKENQVEITVNPMLSEKIKEKIAKIKTDMNISGNFVVLSDNNVKINDCKISFNNGSIEKNTEEVMAKVDDIIKTYRTAIDKKTV